MREQASCGRAAIELPAGRFLYCGSAKGQGGSKARLSRHFKPQPSSKAAKAAVEFGEVGKLIVPDGNPGDGAVNEWIAAMLAIYRDITGKKPATSVGAPSRSNEGIAGGPLIRFLKAAGKPLKIEFAADAWRSRVRTVLKRASEQN